MKKINVLVLGVLIAMGLSSCIKGETYDWREQYELEKPTIADYVAENMPGAILHEPTGIWYKIESWGEPGSYMYKKNYPTVYANYTGKLLDGTEFDSDNSTAGAKFSLSNIIGAWQVAFFPKDIKYDEQGKPLTVPYSFGGITENGLQKGTIIKLVTPSYLAYGQQRREKIPANSPLYFEIKVINIEDSNGIVN